MTNASSATCLINQNKAGRPGQQAVYVFFYWYFFLVYACPRLRPRTQRVWIDCTLSADYYNIIYLLLYIIKLLIINYGEPSRPKPETELFYWYLPFVMFFGKIIMFLCCTLTLATLGNMTYVRQVLFVLCHTRWPRQVVVAQPR
jgi:hypothetical protein